MAPRIGLYYPFIRFRDDNWVKLAALYWARVGRIVPPGYEPQDSPVVKALGEDFVLNVRPTRAAHSLARLFLEVLATHGEKLRIAYGVDQAHAWKPDPVTAQRMGSAQVPVDGVDTAFAYLHTGKLAPKLRAELVDAGLAVPSRGGDDAWIGVHPRVAHTYMTVLADGIANGPSGPQYFPVTDDAMDHVAVSGWTVDRLSAALLDEPSLAENGEQQREIDVALAFVAIKTVVPKDLSSVPIDRIIEVREKYRDEMVHFITQVESIGNDLASLADVKDRQALEAHLQVAYEERIEPQLKELTHDMRLFNIETVTSAANIKVTTPPALTWLGGALGTGLNPVVAAVAGIAVAVTGFVTGRHVRAVELKGASPAAAYLFDVEKGLRTRTLLRRIRGGLRRFV